MKKNFESFNTELRIKYSVFGENKKLNKDIQKSRLITVSLAQMSLTVPSD